MNLDIGDNHLLWHTDEKINMTKKVCYFMFSLRSKVFPRWPFYASERGQRSEFTIEQLLSMGVFKGSASISCGEIYTLTNLKVVENPPLEVIVRQGSHSQKEIFRFHSIMLDNLQDASSEGLFCNTVSITVCCISSSH